MSAKKYNNNNKQNVPNKSKQWDRFQYRQKYAIIINT